MEAPTIPKTTHGTKRADERKFSDEKIRNIIENPSFKFYQAGGIEVYVKKSGRYYDVIIRDRNGIIITEIGGTDKNLKSIKDLQKLARNYSWTTIPLD